MTFFEWPRADPGRLGRGNLESIGSRLVASVEKRGGGSGRATASSVPGGGPRVRDVIAIGNPDLYAGLFG